MDKRTLAASLYNLIETSKDEILKHGSHLGRDHELAPVIYRLLKDDKDSPIYPYVCCIMTGTASAYNNPYARKKYLEEAVAYLRKVKVAEDKVRWVEERLQRDTKEVDKQNLAEEKVVHPDALCRIKGIELFDAEHLNFHDAYVVKFMRTENDFRSDIEMDLRPTWTDHVFRFKFNNVVDFSVNGTNFIELGWVSFYLHNNYLVCDMEGFGEISCDDAELLNANELEQYINNGEPIKKHHDGLG